MPNAEYPHRCRWCAHAAPTYRRLLAHVETAHPVEHWDWLGAKILAEMVELRRDDE